MSDTQRDRRLALILVGVVLATTFAVGWPVLRLVRSGGVTDGIERARVSVPGLDIELPKWPVADAESRAWERGRYRVESARVAGRHAELSWQPATGDPMPKPTAPDPEPSGARPAPGESVEPASAEHRAAVAAEARAAADGLRALTEQPPERTWQFALERVPGAGVVARADGAAVAVASFRCPADARRFRLTVRIPRASLRDMREFVASLLATAVCVQDIRQPE